MVATGAIGSDKGSTEKDNGNVHFWLDSHGYQILLHYLARYTTPQKKNLARCTRIKPRDKTVKESLGIAIPAGGIRLTL
jgi:hypothetical protein